MHLQFVLLVGVLISGSLWDTVCFAETTRTANELVGPVQSVTVKKLGYSATETYDRAGRLIEAALDIPHANAGTYSLFRYDQNGHLQEELVLDPGGKLMFRKQVVYARDSQGRDTAAVTTSENGGFQYAEFFQYDQRGHLLEQLWVNHSIAYRSLFDILGRRIYSARYSKGVLFSELKHQYDAQGRLRELVMYNERGMVTGRVINDYDEMGKRVRATTETFGEDQLRKWVTTYEYDGTGNWIKELTAEQSATSRTTPALPVPLVHERQIQYYNLTENKAPR